MLNNLIMIVLVGLVVYFFYYPIVGKPYPFRKGKSKKKKEDKEQSIKKNKQSENFEFKGSFKELLGIERLLGNVVKVKSEGDEKRNFIGLIKTEPINYLLRSYDEQVQIDKAYEQLLAQLNLGPGREINIGIHIQSRPIDLSEQLRPYEDSFEHLNPVAQRYAESMFFPYMELWQSTVDEFDYKMYFVIDLSYDEKLLDGLDEDSVVLKVQNEFNRIAQIIQRNYNNMGGRSKICAEYELYEAIYFALNKQTGTLEHFQSLIKKDGILSPFINSDYARDAVKFDDVEVDWESEEREAI